jgi:hypothetical protein
MLRARKSPNACARQEVDHLRPTNRFKQAGRRARAIEDVIQRFLDALDDAHFTVSSLKDRVQ